jgi:phage gpG-like protein
MSATLKMDGLQSLIKALEKKSPTARVGILGSSSQRRGKSSNAFIGACHEFGTTTIPQRSFLRVPITERLDKEMKKSGAFTKGSLQEIVQARSLLPWVKKLAIIGEGIVADAFNTGGFGKWPALQPETMKHKRVKQILVETQQLRNSITSEVV